jgi:hypothetical protein
LVIAGTTAEVVDYLLMCHETRVVIKTDEAGRTLVETRVNRRRSWHWRSWSAGNRYLLLVLGRVSEVTPMALLIEVLVKTSLAAECAAIFEAL